jgi:hypothetical protein
MTAAAILARAAAAGVSVTIDGDRLRLTAPDPACTVLMHDLAGAKAEVIALLTVRAADAAAERAGPRMPPPATLERENPALVRGLLGVAAIRPTACQKGEVPA